MPIKQISPKELASKLQLPETQRPILLDVRRPDEHAFVALPQSVLIPLQELEARQDELEAFQGKEVVVYCHHGIRSLHGAAFLESKGIEAASLSGGIERYSVDINPALRRY